jgi:hypothetical protein
MINLWNRINVAFQTDLSSGPQLTPAGAGSS